MDRSTLAAVTKVWMEVGVVERLDMATARQVDLHHLANLTFSLIEVAGEDQLGEDHVVRPLAAADAVTALVLAAEGVREAAEEALEDDEDGDYTYIADEDGDLAAARHAERRCEY